MTTLVRLYETLLDALDVSQNDNGDLSYKVGKTSTPLIIDGKRLVVPTNEILRSGLGKDRIAFHPLAEKPMRGESEVFKKLKVLVTAKLSSSIAQLAEKMLEIAADTSKHKKLPSGAVKLLKQISTADEKTVKAFRKVVEAMVEHPEGRLVKLFTMRPGKIDGESYLRAVRIQFPFMDCFEEGKKEVLGVPMRAKDVEMLQGVMEAILPSIKVTNTYSAGSNSLTAPYLVSLLTAFLRIAQRINEVDAMFSKVEVEGESIAITTEWEPLVIEPEAYCGLIPPLDGNEGAAVKGDDEENREVEVPDARANERAGLKTVNNRRDDDDAPPFVPDAPKEAQPAPVKEQAGPVVTSKGVDFSRPLGPVSTQQRRNIDDSRDDRGRDDRRDSRGNDRRDDDRRYETRSERSDRGDRSWGNEGSRWDEGRGRGRDERERYDPNRRDRGDDRRYRDDRDDRGRYDDRGRDDRRYRDDRDDRRYRDDRYDDRDRGSHRRRSAAETFGRGGRGSGI